MRVYSWERKEVHSHNTYPNNPQRHAMKSTLQVIFGLLFLCRRKRKERELS